MYVEFETIYMYALCLHIPGWMPEVLPGLSWQCFLWHLAGTQVAVADSALLSGPQFFLQLHILSWQCHHTSQIHVDCNEGYMYIQYIQLYMYMYTCIRTCVMMD